MLNIKMDGPLDFDIAGDSVVIRGTSDGDRACFTLTVEDALISRHRFNEAYEAMMAKRAADAASKVIAFPLPRYHADTG